MLHPIITLLRQGCHSQLNICRCAEIFQPKTNLNVTECNIFSALTRSFLVHERYQQIRNTDLEDVNSITHSPETYYYTQTCKLCNQHHFNFETCTW